MASYVLTKQDTSAQLAQTFTLDFGSKASSDNVAHGVDISSYLTAKNLTISSVAVGTTFESSGVANTITAFKNGTIIGLNISGGFAGDNLGGSVVATLSDGSTITRTLTVANASGTNQSAALPQLAAPPAYNSTNRPPSIWDDVTRGFLVNDVTQYDGRTYTCVDNTAGGAAWVMINQLGGADPVKLFAANPGGATTLQCAYGTEDIAAGYTGPLVDVAALTQGASNATSTITAQASPPGSLEKVLADYASTMVDNQVNGIGVGKWYDQSGKGNDGIGDTSTYGVFINRVKSPTSKVCLSVGQLTGAHRMKVPNTCTFVQNNFMAYFEGRIPNAFADKSYMLFELGNDSTKDAILVYINGTGSLYANVIIGGVSKNFGFLNIATSKLFYPSSDWGPFLIWSDANGIYVSHNTTDVFTWFGGAPGSGTMTGGCIFNSEMFQTLQGNVAISLFAAGTAGTPGQRSAMIRGGVRRTGFNGLIKRRVVFVGDSRTQGYQADDGINWPAAMQDRARAVGIGFKSFNLGVSGIQTPAIQQVMMPKVLDMYRANTSNFMVLFAGTNDFAISGSTPQTTVNNLKAMCQQAQAAGYIVVLVGEVSRNDNATANAYIQQVITLLRVQAPAFCNIYVDPTRVPVLNAPTNTTFWAADQLHYNTQGQDLFSSVVLSAMASALAASAP